MRFFRGFLKVSDLRDFSEVFRGPLRDPQRLSVLLPQIVSLLELSPINSQKNIKSVPKESFKVIWEKNLQGLRRLAGAPKGFSEFCRTFGVLQEGSAERFAL